MQKLTKSIIAFNSEHILQNAETLMRQLNSKPNIIDISHHANSFRQY